MPTMGVSGVAGTAGEPWGWVGGDADTGADATRGTRRQPEFGRGRRAGAFGFRGSGIVLGFRAIGPCSSIG